MKKSKSIFLVEDDLDDQDFFIEALSNIENTTLFGIANNGIEALNTLKNSDVMPDLIFTDINMPLMNGIECLSGILKNPHSKDIPVIMLTSDAGKIDLARKIGAKAFITKPSDCELLRKSIERVIALYPAVSSDVMEQVQLPCLIPSALKSQIATVQFQIKQYLLN